MTHGSRLGLSIFAMVFLACTQSAFAQETPEETEPDEEVDGTPTVETDTLPPESSVLYAVFTVVGTEPLTIQLGTVKARDKALAAWRDHQAPGIPVGKLVCQPVEYNAPWSFYVEPTSVNFASGTIELCDAAPSYIQDNCATFGVGTYCPWGAQFVELRACPDATTPVLDCPLVPREN